MDLEGDYIRLKRRNEELKRELESTKRALAQWKELNKKFRDSNQEHILKLSRLYRENHRLKNPEQYEEEAEPTDSMKKAKVLLGQ